MSPLVFLLLLLAVFGLYGFVSDRLFARPEPRARDPHEDERRVTLEDVWRSQERRTSMDRARTGGGRPDWREHG